MKYTKEDNLRLTYKGYDYLVLESEGPTRGGSLSPQTTVYTLETGKKIVPSHFKYGLVKLVGSPVSWLFASSMPGSLLKQVIGNGDCFLKKIKKDDAWSGSNLVVPFN